MARRKLIFDYNKLDSATQVFLMQQESEINSLISQAGLKLGLIHRYSISKKLVEVRSVLQKTNQKCFEPWIETVCKLSQPALYDNIYFYNYINDYLGGIDELLKANPNLAYSVLKTLGRPKTPVNIKQRFAEHIKSGERILYERVDQAIADELLTTIPANQVDDLEKPLLEIKELLNNQDNQESKYHKWLQNYDWIFGLDYKLIESHKNLDDKRIPDFTGVRVHDNFRDIFEIKPPFIPLFQKDDAFTSEFNKAWNEVEEYLNFALEEKDYLRRKELDFENPEGYLIIGYDLSEKQLRKIRTKERLNLAIKVRTYNNLIEWAEYTIKFIKKHKSRK